MKLLQNFNSKYATVFAINLIHKNGGYETILGETEAYCKKESEKLTDKYPDDYIVGTVPYLVNATRINGGVYDVSIPRKIMQSMSLTLRVLAEWRT
jgi:hypothetical protein